MIIIIKKVSKSSHNSNDPSELKAFITSGIISQLNKPTTIEPKISFKIRPNKLSITTTAKLKNPLSSFH